jgi:biopolymer transport protein ExbD
VAKINLYAVDSEISQINMTPFVDIILVVLVIFMATATFVAQGKIPLKLPHASTSLTKEEVQKPIEISITKDGAIFYDRELVDIKTLESKLSVISQQKSILLRSDAKANFESVVSVIDICKKNGIEKFAIQTKNEGSR